MVRNLPTLTPTYIGAIPKFDGNLASSYWSFVAKAMDFTIRGTEKKATQWTEVGVCYDRNAMHFLFECYEDSIDRIITECSGDGQPVWLDDSVTLIIAPHTVAESDRCHQFSVNAAGASVYKRGNWVSQDSRWQTQAYKKDDRWYAEIIVPFEMLRPFGRNEECWRINFYRNEHAHEEQSSWSPVRNNLTECRRLGKLVPSPASYSFITHRGSPVPISSEVDSDVPIQPIPNTPRRVERLEILPLPQEVRNRVTKGPFNINRDTRIVIADDANENDKQIAVGLNAALSIIGLGELQVVNASGIGSDIEKWSNIIIAGETYRHVLLKRVCDYDAIRMPRSRHDTGAHVVDVSEDRIVLWGQTEIDTHWAVQTLKQMINRSDDGSVYVPSALVRDYPRFPFRGVHLHISPDSPVFLTKLIDSVLPALKINRILLQCDNVAWNNRAHRGRRKGLISLDELRKLVELARRNHIFTIPLIETSGDMGASLDLLDEAIEFFDQSGCIHVGRGMHRMRGAMPMDRPCVSNGDPRVFIDETIALHNHLAKRRVQMMMWGDLIGTDECRRYIDRFPKDITIVDWRHIPSDSYPSIDFFQSQGFSMIGGSWYDPQNIYGLTQHAAKRGIMGTLQTTWAAVNTGEELLKEHRSQLFGMVLSAAWSWNPVGPNLERLPCRPGPMFMRLMQGPVQNGSSEYFSVKLDRYCNISRVDSGRSKGWLGYGRGNDLRNLPEGVIRVGRVPYSILPARLEVPAVVLLGGDNIARAFPERVNGIELGTAASNIYFLHACAFGSDHNEHVGTYIIHYQDGKTCEVPLVYNNNICSWDDETSCMTYCFAWRNKAQDGRLIGLYELPWRNERPDVPIKCIDFAAVSPQASPFLVAITGER